MRGKCSGGRVGRRGMRRRGAWAPAGDTPAATSGFTVVELLVVMAIILVLAGLVLATSSYVHNKGARSRAEAEIAAMSAALENYKADNGVYPVDISVDARTKGDPLQYQTAGKTLFRYLTGDLNADGQPDAGVTSYMSFKPNQTGGTSPAFFVKDPFGNSYGYSTAGQAGGTTGYNPTFDLWSTAGAVTSGSPNPVPWIKNW